MSDRDVMDDEAAGTDVDKAIDKLRKLALCGKYSTSHHKMLRLNRVVQSRIKRSLRS